MSKINAGATATWTLALALAALTYTSAGCLGAGSGTKVRADGDLNGPISLSSAVFDERGDVLTSGQGLEITGHFEETRSFWSYWMVWHLSNDWDITDLANQKLKEFGGDAIVNLKVSTSNNAQVFFALLIPIFPAYLDVTLSGDVARLKGSESDTAGGSQ